MPNQRETSIVTPDRSEPEADPSSVTAVHPLESAFREELIRPPHGTGNGLLTPERLLDLSINNARQTPDPPLPGHDGPVGRAGARTTEKVLRIEVPTRSVRTLTPKQLIQSLNDSRPKGPETEPKNGAKSGHGKDASVEARLAELMGKYRHIERRIPNVPEVRTNFSWIWPILTRELEIEVTVDQALEYMNSTVVYDILDGTRSTMTADPFIDNKMDGGLFSLGLITTLKALRARSCVIMVYTAYNRRRGQSETGLVFDKILRVSPLVKLFCDQYDVACSIIAGRTDPKFLAQLEKLGLNDADRSFHAHFLFDYTEEWAMEAGRPVIERLPEIDVCLRHTKFQPFGGGYIPFRMRTASYMYAQNGSVLSNWNTADFTTLAAVALLTRVLNGGEALNKTFKRDDEIIQRYRRRELDLFHRTINLGHSETPKRFMIGCPTGTIEVMS